MGFAITQESLPMQGAPALRSASHPLRLAPPWALVASSILVACLAVSGLEAPLPALGWAAAFLLLATYLDLTSFRIPNWLTLPGLLVAVGVGAWHGGNAGAATALLGAGSALALLLGPFSLRWMGAGDVKGAMVLGAFWGPAHFVSALLWMLVAGGVLAVLLVALRGELGDLMCRWWRSALATVMTRKLTYFPPAGQASSGLPFAVAMVLGAAAHQLWGLPWR